MEVTVTSLLPLDEGRGSDWRIRSTKLNEGPRKKSTASPQRCAQAHRTRLRPSEMARLAFISRGLTNKMGTKAEPAQTGTRPPQTKCCGGPEGLARRYSRTFDRCQPNGRPRLDPGNGPRSVWPEPGWKAVGTGKPEDQFMTGTRIMHVWDMTQQSRVTHKHSQYLLRSCQSTRWSGPHRSATPELHDLFTADDSCGNLSSLPRAKGLTGAPG